MGGDVQGPTAGSTLVRRFAGPVADEYAVRCRPAGRAAAAAGQAEEVYRALAACLAAEGATGRDLVSETLFLRDVRRELPAVLAARERILREAGLDAPAPAFIGQAPVDADVRLELLASLVMPRRRDAWSVRDVRANASCGCDGCARSAGRLVRLGEQASLHTTNVYGAGRDAYERAWNTFCAAESLLAQCGMGFGDVVRTWIHLRDIARDYHALNEARREFFRQRGITRRPASTGVQGIPYPDAHDFSIGLWAVQSPRLAGAPMSTPSLSEAWSYGADFSRGLRVADANKVSLHVSGTASIDEEGRTVHAGDLQAQAGRMLHNVESLLALQGAGAADAISGVAYLRDADDAPVLRAMLRERGFDALPCAVVEAPLCRPELLCEMEVLAVLPLASGGA